MSADRNADEGGNGWSGALPFALVLIALGGLAALIFRPLLPLDETRYLSVAWEMWTRGDWLVPHLNGVPYADKPPLLFWSIHLAWAALGVSESAARLVPIGYALLTVFLTASLARRLWPGRRDVAQLASLILAGTALFALMSSMVMFDTALAAAVLLSIFGIVEANSGRAWLGWTLFGFGIGLGVLAKGPVVLVHVLPVAVLAPVWRIRRNDAWVGWYLGVLGGVLLGAALALAWAVPAAQNGGPAYAEAIFWGQSAGRISGSSQTAHARPFWFYAVLLPALFFPWTIWTSVWKAARRRPVLDEPARLLLTWLVADIIILSLISGKQVHYLVPAAPAFALILSYLLAQDATARRRAGSLIPTGAVLGLAVALIGAEALAYSGHKLTPALDRIPLWLGPVLLGLVAVLFFARRRLRDAFVLGAFTPGVLALALLSGQQAFQAYRLNEIAALAKRHEAAGIAVDRKYHGELTFLGRLSSPVAALDGPEQLAFWQQQHPGGVLMSREPIEELGPGWREIYRQPYRSGTVGLWQAVPFGGATKQ